MQHTRSSGGKGRTTHERLFLEISRTFQLMRLHAEQILKPLDVSLSEYVVLRVVADEPNTTASRICDVLHTTAPTMAHTVGMLEKKKLITRMADTQDARRQHIVLTSAGRKIVQSGKKDLNSFIASLGIRASLVAHAGKEFASLSGTLQEALGGE